MTKPAIGFIGLGVMGLPMARHLAAAGYRLTVMDLNPAIGTAFMAESGDVHAVGTVAEVGTASDIVLTMLPSVNPCKASPIGTGGLIESMRPGGLVLDTSSSRAMVYARDGGTLG